MYSLSKKSMFALVAVVSLSSSFQAQAVIGEDPTTTVLSWFPTVKAITTIYNVGTFMHTMHERQKKIKAQNLAKELQPKKVFKEIKDDNDDN